MKIALVHDYIKEYGGAEKVLETMLEIWPDAQVFTTVYLPEFLGPHKERFQKYSIKPSILQYLPFKSKLISPFRIIAPLIFSSMDFSKFDVVIVSATGAYTPNLIRKGSAVHICYCHTPPRYLYGYATAREWKNNIIFRVLASVANHFLRIIDFKSAQNVDHFIANSEEVARRIAKFYRKKSTVIYPPVDMPDVKNENPVKDRKYYLAGGRLARAKRPDLAILAASKLNIPLKIFGRSFAGYDQELKKMANDNVEFLGEVSEKAKWDLFRNAKAFISPSDTEDFGILNVEVMASGTPVIAYKAGGALETVIDGKTGIFFGELNVESVVAAIKKLEKTKINPEECIKQAHKFSKEKFATNLAKFVDQKVLG